MKTLAFSLILIIFLSGCLARYLESDKTSEQQTEETPQTQGPQVTTIGEATQEAEITTGTKVDIIKSTEPSGPKTYQVNVVQGIGIREGAG